MKDDFVSYVVKLVAKICPSLDAQAALELEDQIRQDWGGNEVGYIAKKRPITPEKKAKAIQEYIEGQDVKEIKKHTGISRTSLYRHLKK
jgi:DNA invertase Pin-like site-specific DNA recombinase